ncbi:MAG: GntR family transcriptional regulator [Rhodococcus sp. (in: high G+C Gram-positive bacteria)]|uniref:GntR family transcriptional regulator n=1 Tax=Rhodococcus sp. TaxID=1831 RepID=UPI002AD717C0|nr:GntR family transcriptional regulator [Rhodococcus sp. (in: high G+C Gram-positive bacteria)]
MSGVFTAISGTGPLRDRIYVALRHDLMAGSFEPTARLGEEKLAEAYGVSRTPVREALARLLSDGLVQRFDTGLYPYRPRLEDLAGLYELRITLEMQGITRIVDTAATDTPLTHDRDLLVPLVGHWRHLRSTLPEPDAGFVGSDEEFHVTVLTSSGNRALAEALRAVNARIRPVRMFDYLTPDRMVATIDEHIDVGERILDGDLVGARRSLGAHIDYSQQVVIARVTEALSMAKFARSVQH